MGSLNIVPGAIDGLKAGLLMLLVGLNCAAADPKSGVESKPGMESKPALESKAGMESKPALESKAGVDPKANPYDAIAERNPFHLKDPPPPPDPNDVPKGPPPVIPTVEVTGIFNNIVSKKKQVFLEIVPAPGKPVVRVTLSEGEKGEAVEVLGIDLDKNEVALNNSGYVTNVALKTASKTPTAGAPTPGVPGLLIPPGANPSAYVPPAAAPAYAGGVPTANGGRGSVVAGALPAAASPNAYGANPAGAYNTPLYNTPTTPPAYNPNGNTTVSDFQNLNNTRTIPPRTLRTQTAQPDVPVDPAVQYINMAVQQKQYENNTGRAFPPLPPIPGFDPTH